MPIIVGIDLGTTNSAVGWVSDDGPRLIPNALGETLTPSVVGIDDESRVLIGKAAKELQVVHPERCAALFKRRMGTDWKVKLSGRTYTPEELSGLVLRSLKHDAEAHFGGPVERAVISVPAYFNEHQRKATLNAGRIAGLAVERIINEPTAAALAYGHLDRETERVLLVFDLGGGTFDVSVVDVMEGALEVRSSSGDGFLGGEDFTAAMAARILERKGLTFERAEVRMPLLVGRLIQQCERAKRELAMADQATIRVPDKNGEFSDPNDVETVSREEFDRWTEGILARVELPLRRALADAGLKRSDIDQVILVGGATRMRSVVERVESIFSKPAQRGINPDEVVALGAAIQAGLIAKAASCEDLVVTDVAPFSLGIEISKHFGHEYRAGYYLPIISRNTTIPVSKVSQISTIQPNQTEIQIKIYQGESRRVEENVLLGKFTVKGVPRGPSGQGVEIRFTYDLNGVLEVEATISATQQKITHIIASHAKGLTPEEIARAVRTMQALKTHPREEAENRWLLNRAERLFAELGPGDRLTLTDLLDGFESSLELGEKDAIEQFRRELAQFLSLHDPGMDNSDEEDRHASW